MNIYQFLQRYRIYTPVPLYSVVSGSYSISYPNGGDVATSSFFTASLLSSIPGSMVVTPVASNNDGVFSPATVTLSNASPTQQFAYTPSLWGVRSISYSNDIGATDPSSHNFVSKIQTGPIGYAIPSGAIGANLGGFSILNGSSLWLREFTRIISGEPKSAQSDGIIAKLTAGSYKMRFVAGASWKGQNSSYTTPFNVVSGNTEFLPLKTVTYPNAMSPTGMPFIQGLAQQTWPYFFGLVSGVKPGHVHITGSQVSNFSVYKSGDTVLFSCNGFGFPIFFDPTYYEVQSVITDAVLVLKTPYMGPTNAFAYISGPYNRSATYEDSFPSDAHLHVYLRNEETGGGDLYEGYNTYTSGSNLRCTSSVFYDYEDTRSPANNVGTTTAAGIPMAPLTLTYDEAANDRINHCIAMTLTNYGFILQNKCVWPGLAVAAGLPGTGVPYGGRFRLRKDWCDANSGSFSPINRNILKAMRDYGLIVADGGLMLDIWIAGDDRWNPSDFTALSNIPASALEVPYSADAPQWSLTGPVSGACGVSAGPWTWNYLIDDNINLPRSDWYIKYTFNPGGSFTTGPAVFFQDYSGRGPYTFNWTPPQTGLYYCYLQAFNQNGYWLGPPSVTGVSPANFTFLSY